MKRFLAAALCLIVLLGQAPIVLAAAPAYGGPMSASGAILMDAASGRVLYERAAHEKRLIASVTKLMTALVALESGHALDEVVTIDPAWVGVEGSSIYLRAGEELTLEALLYGMLLRSGNDAAAAVAGHCGGSEEAFVAKMNEKAARLGMADSHFENPSGLNADGHCSTAYDLALLARACLENGTLAEIVSTKTAVFGTRTFTNHNKLLWRYEGCVGLKTGFTEKAGRTLVSAAERDGMTLICVTLNAPDDWRDHAALFDWGFANFSARTMEVGTALCSLSVEGSLVPFCPVTAGERAALCLAPGETVERKFILDSPSLTAPVSAGERVGEAVYYVDGREAARVPLTAGRDVPRDEVGQPSLWEWMLERLK